mgnify:CR=1 FL=1
MKKKYVMPQIEVIKMECSQMLCMSGGEDGNGRPAQVRPNSSWFDDDLVETNDEPRGYSCW